MTGKPLKTQKEKQGRISAENSGETAGNVIPLKPGQEVSKPYQQTPQEVAVVARYQKRKASVPDLPAMKTETKGPDEKGVVNVNISLEHADQGVGHKLIADALNSGDMKFVFGLMHDISGLGCSEGGMPNVERANYALSIAAGLKPRDSVEAMLAVQMAAIHMATIKAASNLSASPTAKGFALYESSVNKLGRTFTTQMEALKRYRSKRSQRIVVERVNVSEGGQAIVGNVAGRGEAE